MVNSDSIRMKNNTAIILILLLIATNIAAQIAGFKSIHYSVDDGLSQGSANCIFQDTKGFIWIGTQDGLNKFDGYKFTTYQHNPLDTNSISANWVYGIDEDDNGILWIATQNGLNALNPRTNKFKHYYTNQQSLSKNEEIFAVLVGTDGYIWFKSSKYLYKLDTSNNNISVYEHNLDYFVNNKSEKGFPMIEDAESIWIGTANGLFQFIKKMEIFKQYKNIPEDPNSLSSNFVTSIAIDEKLNIWVGTTNGLNKLDKKRNKFIRYFASNKNPSIGPAGNNIIALYNGKNGKLWIGTFGSGLSLYDPNTNQFYHFKHEDGNENSIYYDYILSLYEDKTLNLWIGYDANGLNKIDLKPQKFKTYQSSKSKKGLHLSSDNIASIYLENDSTLWIGTWENGLNIVNRNNFSTKLITTQTPNQRIVGNNVHAIYADSHGLIWIGTKSGISIYDKKTKTFSDLDAYFKIDLNLKLKGIRIYNITEDYKGNIWISTRNGLYRFNYDTKTITSFVSSLNDSLSLYDNSVICTVCDKNGYVWIGTRAGLNRYDYNTNKCFRIGYKKSNKPITGSQRIYAVPSNPYIYHVIEDMFDENILWVGTSSGLNRFNKLNNTFEYYTIADGLPNGTIYEIIQDKNGNLWMSTNRGLAFFDVNQKKITAFDVNDGIQGLEFNNGASYIAPSGEIFFGGVKGITAFNPNNQKENTFIPNVVFTTFEKTTANGKKEIMNISDLNLIELRYDDHSITFSFAALEFTNPRKNTFKYWIEGLMNDWIFIGNKNFIDIGVLAPGEYTLHLKGSNNDGVWNEKEASIKIIVYPPFYKTTWAYIGYVIIISAIIFFYVRSRTKKLQEANEILRQKQLASLEIARQKEELSIKNKNITDSINYAKRIQEALLPSEYLFRKLLPDSFILYKPRDIVSGDFYWIYEKESKIFVAAVDCTGHGVPGAFMSIIGFDLLKNITREQNVEDPAEILNLLNMGVADTFSKQSTDYEIKDGMDVSLLVIDRVNKQLHYAG
ncbi:MAG: ligand-binding sensor domain-containing protein, partial [Bacteroidales bacterium]